MHKLLRTFLLSAAALGPFYTTPGLAADTDASLVTAPDGTFQGKLSPTNSVREFLGIRYAQPVIGDLRWRAPQPLAHSDATQDATKFADHCPQQQSIGGNASMSEDCLFLNVYSPSQKKDAADSHPVVVYIHGGTLITGDGDYLGAAKLVANGVVVVTINYRLGALGFLAHPALTAESPDRVSGNYGIEDQQAALGWVQRNIKAFGGDPSRVTLAGESAGGLSTLTNLVSPTAKGLFQRAIVMSGAYFQNQPPMAKGEAAGVDLANAVGCGQSATADVLKCLRALPVAKVLAYQRLTYVFGPGIGPAPLVDGKIMTMPINAALASGQFNHVPLMNGSTHDESNLFVAETYDLGASGPVNSSNYVSVIGSFTGSPSAAYEIADRYRVPAQYPSYDQGVGRAGTDSGFACTARFVDELASPFVPTFAYEFSDEGAPQNFDSPVSFPYGAAHASDIQYVFQFANPFAIGFRLTYPPLSADQEKLSDKMVAYWARFAATGDPNGPGLPAWPRYDRKGDAMQAFVPPTPNTETNFRTVHDCDFWDKLAGRTLP